MSKNQNLPGHISDQQEKIKQREKLYKDTVHALQTEERFQNFFKNYNAESVNRFIEHYANQKTLWYSHGPLHANLRKHDLERFYNTAWEVLIIIQNRKLLELKARWLANEIKIDGVQICYDLQFLSKFPLTSKAVPPVNQYDIDFFTAYVNQLSGHEDFTDSCSSSMYTFLVLQQEDLEMEDYEPYHRYCDEHSGTDLRKLKDVRHEKESFYRANKTPEAKAAFQKLIDDADAARDKRPHLPSVYNKEFMPGFVKQFETKHIQELYRANRLNHAQHQFHERLDGDMYMLDDVKEYIPVNANDDWREAFMEAAEMYRRKKTFEILPLVFEKYLGYIRTGTNIYEAEGFKSPTDYDDEGQREKVVQEIINGRVLNDEPADLNF